MGKRSPFATGFLVVELFYGGTWHDVSADVSADGVRITRGRGDGASRAEPSSLSLSLRNGDGKYSPRNPRSPLYGLIGRNTPIRVSANHTGAISTWTRRFTGEVTEWPQRWGRTGSPSAYAPIVAAGILRRLQAGASPLRSPLYRVLSTVGPDLVAYWPMEEGSDASRYASALTGRALMTVTGGTPSSAAHDGFAASDPIPTLQDGRLYGAVRGFTGTGEAQVRMLLRIPTATPTGVFLRVRLSGGTLSRVDVGYPGATAFTIEGFNSAGASVGAATWGLNPGGKKLRFSLELLQSGGNVLPTIATYEPGAANAGFVSGTFTGVTLGSVSSVELNPLRTALGDVAVGHVTVEKAITSIFSTSVAVLVGHRGEPADERFMRLCDELAVPATTTLDGALTPSQAMGPQRSATFVDLLAECVDSGHGILREPRNAASLDYRTLASTWAQTPALSLPYQDNLVRPFEPTDDDANTKNLVTVTRAGGSSATAELTTGALSTQAPPNGVGVYDDAVELSLDTDAQARDVADWRLAVGTVDEARWPAIGFDLADDPFVKTPNTTAAQALRESVLKVDVGDLVEITDLPSWLPPDKVSVIVQGYTETIEPLHHRIEFTTTPASPYRVGKYGTSGTAARYDGAGTVLAEDLTTTETGVDVTPPAGVVWTHADGDYPVTIGGEEMTVTAVSALSGGNQTLTVVRSVNGIVKTHSTGADVRLTDRSRYGL